MAEKRKATFQPYDMDTAAGTNNSGVLMFGYALEDTDTVSSIISGGDDGGKDAPVFNAQDSVLWCNFRDCFRSEITQMYRSLRTSRALDYKDIMQRRHDHQSYWPEAMFNEDQYEKHLVPLIDPVTVDETTGQLVRTDRYLTMIQGSKEEQFKWWLYNRFRYSDSKYVTGDAVNNIISMRVFNSGTLTLTPAIDLYVGVSFGGGTTVALKRTTANVSKSFEYQAETGVTEMETWIYSGDLIADLGDLSVFYGNEFDLSKATRLRRLKIGDPAATYSNANLVTLDLRNMGLLEYLDLRNCPNLAIPINLEGSPRLEEAYFEGTAITGVDIAEGGSIEKLHLPGTIATLTLINLTKLTDFQCPSLANVSRLMLSNMDQDVIDPIDVLAQIKPNSQINIQGLYLECEDAQEIEGFLNILDTMQGVSRERGANGEWLYHDYDTAQVSGTIHTTSLTGEQIASYNERYPYITVKADSILSHLTYKTWDGSSTVATVECYNGVPKSGSPSVPARTSTMQYDYTAVGWNTKQDAQSDDPSSVKDVIADRTVYAAYSRELRSHTITFVRGSADGGGTLQSSSFKYGTTPSYNGATPTTTQGSAEDYPFEGWTPAIGPVTGPTTYTAKFGSPVEDVEISDSWDTIIANIDNGTYKTAYKIGNYKPLDLGTEGTVNMQIVAMDADVLTSGGYAPLTFIAKELLASKHSHDYWFPNRATAMRYYLNNTVINLVPENVRARLQDVVKYYYYSSQTYGSGTRNKLWIPSIREINPKANVNYMEDNGVSYENIYKSDSSRRKVHAGETSASNWWLRTNSTNNGEAAAINTGGNFSTSGVNTEKGVCLGFCLGLEPETITDSWSEIFAAEQDGTYSTKYSIGDTKMLDLGTEGQHLMEIVAFDEDDKADSTGKAKITWISKDLLATEHRMNSTNTTEGGWEQSILRDYLKTTIKPLIPQSVRDAIVPVTKVSSDYDGSGGDIIVDGQTTTDDVWIPSHREIFNNPTFESTGAVYSSRFTSNSNRIKKKNGSATYWWLRSVSSGTRFRYIKNDGSGDNVYASGIRSIALGFCT